MSKWILVVVALAGCAQFKPPAEGGGGASGGGGGGGAARCRVPGSSYTYADEQGSKIEGDGLHVRGKLAPAGEVFAGVGMSFGPFDASKYEGIAFEAKRSATSTPHVRIKVPDASTDPKAGVCTECYNDFGLPFQLTEAWTRYEVRFTDLVQEEGWGNPRPASIDASKLYAVQWQVATAGAEFEVWVQNVQFLGCE